MSPVKPQTYIYLKDMMIYAHETFFSLNDVVMKSSKTEKEKVHVLQL